MQDTDDQNASHELSADAKELNTAMLSKKQKHTSIVLQQFQDDSPARSSAQPRNPSLEADKRHRIMKHGIVVYFIYKH